MKKLLALSLIGSSLMFGSNQAKADWDFWAIDYSGDASIGSRIYTCVSDTGVCTQRTTKVFHNNQWDTANSYVDDKNNLVIYESRGRLQSYDLDTDTWTDVGNGWNNNFIKIFERATITETSDGVVSIGIGSSQIKVDTDSVSVGNVKLVKKNQDGTIQVGTDVNDIDLVEDGLNIDGAAVITKNADGTIQIGTDENDIDITPEGLAIDGEPLITKKANGELHIGKNSWITKEDNGKQKVWAKDANGNSIPIDYTNGTKLLINGRDVEQSINNVGALSAALTGLPTVPTDTTLACGLGTGTHGGDFAFSGGCASKVNEKLSINYAASMTMPGQDYAGDFEDTFSARAGFVWKLGKPVKSTLISMEAKEKMEEKIYSLEENNKKIITQNTDLIQKNQSMISQNKALLARLERLEKVALGNLKIKDLAVYELK